MDGISALRMSCETQLEIKLRSRFILCGPAIEPMMGERSWRRRRLFYKFNLELIWWLMICPTDRFIGLSDFTSSLFTAGRGDLLVEKSRHHTASKSLKIRLAVSVRTFM